MMESVTISPFLRPTLSIYAPSTMAPIGRIKARAEDGEGHHQRRKFTARREERMGDVGGIEAEQKEIELLKKVAGRHAKYGARFRAYGCR